MQMPLNADSLPLHAGYGQQAGGTHPTGMHTCRSFNFTQEETDLLYFLLMDQMETEDTRIPSSEFPEVFLFFQKYVLEEQYQVIFVVLVLKAVHSVDRDFDFLSQQMGSVGMNVGVHTVQCRQ